MRQRRSACWALLVALGSSAFTARADDLIVYSPHVMQSQREVEWRGYRVIDGRGELDGTTESELSISYSPTSWWRPEVYVLEYQKSPDSRGRLHGWEFENTFQLTAPGEYAVDVGWLASYAHSTVADQLDTVEFGPLFERTFGRFTHRVNFIWEKEIGSGANPQYEFRYSYSGSYAFSKALRVGLEAYGRPADRAYQSGPILSGEWHPGRSMGNIEYRLGALFGINSAAPRGTVVMQLEYEFF